MSRYADARRTARALLERFGVERPEHIEIDAMARALGAIVIDAPELVSADARLTRMGRHTVIRLSTRVRHPGRRRFTLAHELGHLALATGTDDLTLTCDGVTSPHARDREGEADAFAAELLMPSWLVRPRCEVSPLSLEIAQEIAATFGTSLVASAVRLAELTSERCAIVYSEAGAVRWAARSSTFRPFIEAGARLDPASVAYDLARGMRHPHDDRAQPIAAEAWLETEGKGGDLIEHSTPIPETGGVLSLLWVPESASRRLGMGEDD